MPVEIHDLYFQLEKKNHLESQCKLGPTYNEFFKLKLVKYNLRGTGTTLEQPHFNLEWLHKSFSYITSTLWNNLPVEIREFKDNMTFKTSVSRHMFS